MRRGLMALLAVLVVVLPVMAAEKTGAEQARFMADTVDLRCDSLDRDVAVRILVPENYRWDDEVYTQLVVMDSRPDEEIAALVSGFVSARDDVLPMVIIRVPESVVDSTPVKDWMAFLNDKVFPYVEVNYRTRPFRVLAGNLVDAGTVLAVGAADPGLFHGLIAGQVSDYPLSDSQMSRVAGSFAKQTPLRLSLFLVSRDDPQAMAPFSMLEKELKTNDDVRVRLVVVNRESVDRQQAESALFQKGLAFCYADWMVRDELTAVELDGLKDHYESVSRLTGVDIPVPQKLVDRRARELLQKGKMVQGMEALRFNARMHPESATSRAAVAYAYFGRSRFRLAAMSFKEAVAIAEHNNHPVLVQYRIDLKAAYQEMNVSNPSGNTGSKVSVSTSGR